MAQAMINFRMDEDLKKNMEQTCREMGMSMTTAFTVFATKVAREKRIPFEIRIDIPNEETKQALAEKEVMKDKNKYKRYSSFSELLEDK